MNQPVNTTVPAPGRVGPNAIIRIAEALESFEGRERVEALLEAAGLAHYLDAMPETMVDEREVTRLHVALRELIGVEGAKAVSRDAGVRTGDYLLARRIPRPAQRLLKILPAPLASRVLMTAIRRNAWTFAGSGRFEALPAYPPRFIIEDGPICAGARAEHPLCDFYAGTFERLYRKLVQREARVTETACQAKGAETCVFEVRW
ncbi:MULTISPECIES: bacteriochlorophyll 4-vinyl reductase [Marichromatium]|uniref:Divinyl protochlorophyllide a 8-vinyl-reductase n=1 Tax=Marichromatium gracile TaxID=1048 RepID=A0A4R4AGC7_MARGR|nr:MULTISPECIES: bacteriochlorophyll 4-vinyl reductase [Marichromatium]MBO8084479.1 bacteriochlorophyll 4-vinyl reductase [Marichromatium sp.]MBK1708267.1 bacteriochlorophyll 4-vinyl reductase [Marichromatium gracile]RNE90785.1 bacteriochlorophyll 4-vinyl reductase [Marichromatium sp. AB31]RNE94442.1 bacteriochlorophyll 4-vinyl reductase [Marichromatium sp. AB32]TCW38271.1 divinyl protochlorophyllide a 8-vinyl-reductase [Marichromatium gracile]